MPHSCAEKESLRQVVAGGRNLQNDGLGVFGNVIGEDFNSKVYIPRRRNTKRLRGNGEIIPLRCGGGIVSAGYNINREVEGVRKPSHDGDGDLDSVVACHLGSIGFITVELHDSVIICNIDSPGRAIANEIAWRQICFVDSQFDDLAYGIRIINWIETHGNAVLPQTSGGANESIAWNKINAAIREIRARRPRY